MTLQIPFLFNYKLAASNETVKTFYSNYYAMLVVKSFTMIDETNLKS